MHCRLSSDLGARIISISFVMLMLLLCYGVLLLFYVCQKITNICLVQLLFDDDYVHGKIG